MGYDIYVVKRNLDRDNEAVVVEDNDEDADEGDSEFNFLGSDPPFYLRRSIWFMQQFRDMLRNAGMIADAEPDLGIELLPPVADGSINAEVVQELPPINFFCSNDGWHVTKKMSENMLSKKHLLRGDEEEVAEVIAFLEKAAEHDGFKVY